MAASPLLSGESCRQHVDEIWRVVPIESFQLVEQLCRAARTICDRLCRALCRVRVERRELRSRPVPPQLPGRPSISGVSLARAWIEIGVANGLGYHVVQRSGSPRFALESASDSRILADRAAGADADRARVARNNVPTKCSTSPGKRSHLAGSASRCSKSGIFSDWTNFSRSAASGWRPDLSPRGQLLQIGRICSGERARKMGRPADCLVDNRENS